MIDFKRVEELLTCAKAVALQYYELTGKPLGIAGEYGEYLAAKHLNLDLLGARTAGFDATDKSGRRIQIKARVIGPKGPKRGRVGSIKLTHPWDAAVLVLMNQSFDPVFMFEADREALEARIRAPGSKARNERGSLDVSQFCSVARRVWPPEL